MRWPSPTNVHDELSCSERVQKSVRAGKPRDKPRLQIFVLMPHARSAHHPRSASNKTNNPETSKSRRSKTENWKETIAVTSKTTPARPRTIRPLVSMLRGKYLFIAFGVCLSSNYSAISKCPVFVAAAAQVFMSCLRESSLILRMPSLQRSPNPCANGAIRRSSALVLLPNINVNDVTPFQG